MLSHSAGLSRTGTAAATSAPPQTLTHPCDAAPLSGEDPWFVAAEQTRGSCCAQNPSPLLPARVRPASCRAGSREAGSDLKLMMMDLTGTVDSSAAVVVKSDPAEGNMCVNDGSHLAAVADWGGGGSDSRAGTLCCWTMRKVGEWEVGGHTQCSHDSQLPVAVGSDMLLCGQGHPQRYAPTLEFPALNDVLPALALALSATSIAAVMQRVAAGGVVGAKVCWIARAGWGWRGSAQTWMEDE